MVIVTCPSCQAKNRIDETRAAARQPVCGRCGSLLPATTAAAPAHNDLKPSIPPDTTPAPEHPSHHVLPVTDGSLPALLQSSGSKPVLVDCWAPWCGPCRMIAPILEQLAHDSAGRYVVAKLNVDENPRSAASFKIDSIPTLLLFREGRLVDRLVGLHPKPVIARALEGALAHG